MILVKFETSAQITHDEWRSYWIEKVFNEFATLNEIIEWAKEKQNTLITRLNGYRKNNTQFTYV